MRRINKKYQDALDKIQLDLIGYDPNVVRVVDGFGDSGLWGVTKNDNIVYLGEGEHKHVTIQKMGLNTI